jgi:hypothetical protein
MKIFPWFNFVIRDITSICELCPWYWIKDFVYQNITFHSMFNYKRTVYDIWDLRLCNIICQIAMCHSPKQNLVPTKFNFSTDIVCTKIIIFLCKTNCKIAFRKLLHSVCVIVQMSGSNTTSTSSVNTKSTFTKH